MRRSPGNHVSRINSAIRRQPRFNKYCVGQTAGFKLIGVDGRQLARAGIVAAEHQGGHAAEQHLLLNLARTTDQDHRRKRARGQALLQETIDLRLGVARRNEVELNAVAGKRGGQTGQPTVGRLSAALKQIVRQEDVAALVCSNGAPAALGPTKVPRPGWLTSTWRSVRIFMAR